MTDRGVFISLEGSEGVGKTTNLDAARAAVEAAGCDVLVTREPGGTPLAEDIRNVLLAVRDEAVDPVAETLLMFAARAQHVASVIEPALASGRSVLCDRFTDATFAYQGGGRGVDAALIERLADIAHPGLWPDLTIYLDVPVADALARIQDRELDRFEREQQAFFQRVRDTYLERAAQFDRFRVIDAGQPLAQVQSAVQDAVAAFLS